MKHDGLATNGVHIPVPLSPEEDLLERRIEIINLFSGTNVTASDQQTEAYQRLASFAGPSTEWESREAYIARCYLTSLADQLLIWAIDAGIAPIIADIQGRGHARLDHRIFFGLNRWWPQDTIGSARYKPMNEGCDGEAGRLRAAASGLPLWIRSEEWDGVVDQIIRRREEIAREEFPRDRLALRRMFAQTGSTYTEMPHANMPTANRPYWSLYEAVAWLGSQDAALVESQQPHHFPSTDAKHYGAVAWLKLKQSLADRAIAGKASMTADAARNMLLGACETGQVPSTGIPALKGDRRPIPANDFIGSQLWEGRGGALHRVVAGIPEEARWHDIRFRADDVKALINVSAPPTPAPPVPDRLVKKPPVSGSELRAWVKARNADGWSQGMIVKGAVDAFPDKEVPGRPTLRELDADARVELGLPQRTRGRDKKGR